ncbi:MAG: class I SAM-dependent methyltransferase [Microscillaceae bacterium]|jgi:SAM-dependent methyltransferase|nr:class I SAM-dependent methyltransferase [Microscillaceae bacterium]
MFKKIVAPILFLGFFLMACEKPSKSEKVNEDEVFFNALKTYASDTRLYKRLDAVGFNAQDVVSFCNEVSDLGIKAKFVKYVTTRAKNQLEEAKKGFWGSIRYNMDSFLGVVSMLKERQHKTFMDIGSGNGEKLYAALCLGFENVKGLEYSKESKELSEAFLKDFISNKKAEIIQGDALEIDGQYFAQADFAYMYSPMKDNEAMATLFKRVMDNMKEGAVFLEVRNVYYKQLREKIGYQVPQHKGWFAVKKEGGKFFYRTSLENEEWNELEKI